MGCGGDSTDGGGDGACAVIPTETAGPYPGDGSNGQVTFTTIFPACYSGRWPHIHFEVYPSLATATASRNKVATSQLALPEDACDAVYATTGYTSSVPNLQQVSLSSDNVFSDGSESQLAAISGNVTAGYVATLTVGINA